MALFKLRKKKVAEPVAAASPAESIETMRRRARHRLIGAVVLVLAGVIGFPILFDTQPRPVAVDIPIEIPDRNKVKPLPAPAQSPVSTGRLTAAPVASAPPAKENRAEPAPTPTPTAQAPIKPAPVEKIAKADAPEKKPEPKAETRPEPKVAASAAAKARALLDGQSVDASAGRYVVQVGAFAEEAKARMAQQKLERAGFRNYRQVTDTEEGKRIRVRAGPFGSRAEADKAAEKIKGLDLPVRILTL